MKNHDPLAWKPDTRIKILYLLLLSKSSNLTCSELGNILKVSRSSIMNDLKRLEPLIISDGLKLIRKRNFGLQIKGQEKTFRKIYITLLFQLAENEIQEKCLSFTDKEVVVGNNRIENELLSELRLHEFYSLVRKSEISTSIKLTELSRQYLALYISIVLHRIKQENIVETIKENSGTFPTPTYFLELLTNIVNSLSRNFGIELPDVEKDMLLHHIIACEVALNNPQGTSSDLSPQFFPSEHFSQAKLISNRIIDKLSKVLHPWIALDEELSRDLSYRIAYIVFLRNLDIPFINLHSHEVENQYPEVLSVVTQAITGKNSPREIDFSQDEISDLTMLVLSSVERLRISPRCNVLVVCATGLCASQLLKSRIRSMIPELKIFDYYSSFTPINFSRIDPSINAIITTIPININLPIPIIKVSPLLPEEDVQRIRDALGIGENTINLLPSLGKNRNLDKGLTDLLTEKTVDVGVRARNWREVVDMAVKPLIESGAVELGYREAIKSLIDEFGPYIIIWPKVAILHAHPDSGANRLAMSLITLEEPVPFNKNGTQLVEIAFAFSTIDYKKHLTALGELHALLNMDEFTPEIMKARSKKMILALIRKYSSRVSTSI